MVEINLNSIGHDEKITLDDSVMAVFVTGSSVNGYFCDDSDIDVVAVFDSETKPVENLGTKVSVHHISKGLLDYYEKAKYYCVLHTVPLINSEYVGKVSFITKRETIMREAKKLQRLHKKRGHNGNVTFEPIELLFRYFTREWGIIEPWRMKPLKRITASAKSREILAKSYTLIFNQLVEDGFLMKDRERYFISPTAVLNNDGHQISGGLGKFSYHFRESCGGLVYLRNAADIIRNIIAVNSL